MSLILQRGQSRHCSLLRVSFESPEITNLLAMDQRLNIARGARARRLKFCLNNGSMDSGQGDPAQLPKSLEAVDQFPPGGVDRRRKTGSVTLSAWCSAITAFQPR